MVGRRYSRHCPWLALVDIASVPALCLGFDWVSTAGYSKMLYSLVFIWADMIEGYAIQIRLLRGIFNVP